MSSDPIVVLGGGPAGISAAWRLSELGQNVVVLERDAALGGMGKTIRVGRYAVDYGPHTFHIRETEESRAIHDAIRPFFGPDPLILTRGTRVLLRGKEYVYPLEMLQVLTGVSPFLSARIIFDYVVATTGRYDLMAELVSREKEELVRTVEELIGRIDRIEQCEVFYYLRLLYRSNVGAWGASRAQDQAGRR